MRYAVAFVLAVVPIAAMFAFAAHMERQVEIWIEQDVALTGFQLAQLSIADWWMRYWYAGGLIILGISLAIAAVLKRR